MIVIDPGGFGYAPSLSPVEPECGDTTSIKLGPQEQEWLVRMAANPSKRISRLVDEPPIRTMNSLVRKGLAKNIMSTFWELTELGQQRCTTIY